MPASRIKHPRCPACGIRCQSGDKLRLRRHMKNKHSAVMALPRGGIGKKPDA